jgi:hypothetical protein
MLIAKDFEADALISHIAIARKTMNFIKDYYSG